MRFRFFNKKETKSSSTTLVRENEPDEITNLQSRDKGKEKEKEQEQEQELEEDKELEEAADLQNRDKGKEKEEKEEVEESYRHYYSYQSLVHDCGVKINNLPPLLDDLISYQVALNYFVYEVSQNSSIKIADDLYIQSPTGTEITVYQSIQLAGLVTLALAEIEKLLKQFLEKGESVLPAIESSYWYENLQNLNTELHIKDPYARALAILNCCEHYMEEKGKFRSLIKCIRPYPDHVAGVYFHINRQYSEVPGRNSQFGAWITAMQEDKVIPPGRLKFAGSGRTRGIDETIRSVGNQYSYEFDSKQRLTAEQVQELTVLLLKAFSPYCDPLAIKLFEREYEQQPALVKALLEGGPTQADSPAVTDVDFSRDEDLAKNARSFAKAALAIAQTDLAQVRVPYQITGFFDFSEGDMFLITQYYFERNEMRFYRPTTFDVFMEAYPDIHINEIMVLDPQEVKKSLEAKDHIKRADNHIKKVGNK